MASDPTRPSILPAAVEAYIAARTEPADAVLVELRRRTAELGSAATMQIGADQGALLTLFTRLTGAANAVEVGTFTGYSAICIARGLVEGGRLLCCDVSETYTALAREAWAQAGLEDRIELRLAPAIDTLRSLPADDPIDLAFIDADKGGYLGYYEEVVARLRPNGVVVVDNTLWSGRVVDDDDTARDTRAIRAFNDAVAADVRVDSYILPVGDGLTLIRKRD